MLSLATTVFSLIIFYCFDEKLSLSHMSAISKHPAQQICDFADLTWIRLGGRQNLLLSSCDCSIAYTGISKFTWKYISYIAK